MQFVLFFLQILGSVMYMVEKILGWFMGLVAKCFYGGLVVEPYQCGGYQESAVSRLSASRMPASSALKSVCSSDIPR